MPRSMVSKACDACRKRKVKCTGSSTVPCEPCQETGLQCTFIVARQRKGRKGETANVLTALRAAHGEALQPAAQLPAFSFDTINFTSPTYTLDAQTSPPIPDTASLKPRFQRTPGLLTTEIVTLCADLFFSQLGSTVPILTPSLLSQALDAAHAEDLYEEPYCLIAAFTAFVILQTGGPNAATLASLGVVQDNGTFGQILLKEALAARSHVDLLAVPTLQTVTLTFFIYGCHSALGKHRQAWYFLREATTLYTSATLDSGSESVDEALGRMFWLLLVSERSHAIRRRRPITLQITNQSPTLSDVVKFNQSAGFKLLAELFRPVDDNFIALWNRASDTCSSFSLVELEQEIQAVVPPSHDMEDTQLANLRVSQQWLRVIVWQLCTMLGFLSSEAVHDSLTFRYPLRIARDLAISTWKLPLHSMQMHGIGLTEKVFDIACNLTDVISCIPASEARAKGFEIGPEDNLKHFFSLISQLPGGRSKYLPLLLSKVDQTLPSMTAPITKHLQIPEEPSTR